MGLYRVDRVTSATIMLRTLSPTFLTLSLALPGASWALGLGDIHVTSALHQRLLAQIELVGATNEELPKLNGAIASEETFQRYDLDRPAFLAATALVVGQDKQGRPVLNLHSTEPFTEPVVTFLVDLHSPSGELIREYTVLLDPPDFAVQPSGVDAAAVAASAAVAPAPAAAPAPGAETSTSVARPERASAAPNTNLQGKTYTVASRDTLDRIVTIAGTHSRFDRHRMMVAIFRANPGAFRANLNLLRNGATLHIPSQDELSAISVEDAKREYDAQMAAWRAADHRSSAAATQPATTNQPAAATGAPKPIVDTKPETDSQETDNAVLAQRVASLEKSLDELKQELNQPPAMKTPMQQPPAMQTTAAAAAKSAPATDTSATQSEESEDDSSLVARHRVPIALLAAGLVLALAASTWVYLRRRSRLSIPAQPRKVQESRIVRETEQAPPVEFSVPPPPLTQIEVTASPPVEKVNTDTDQASPKTPRSESDWFKDSFSTPIGELLANELATKLGETPTQETRSPGTDTEAWAAEVLHSAVESRGDTVEQKFNFFNPESNANTTHVVIDSGLKEPPAFVERRKNPADVLQQAIEREPDRSDLRLKLLELYYTAAEQNRRAFLEATRQLAKNHQLASAEDWSRIADMGRTIAPEDELFSETVKDKAVA